MDDSVHSDVIELCEHAANNESESVGNIDGVISHHCLMSPYTITKT